MTGQFDDWKEGSEERERQLAAVEALDGLEEDATSYEAGFLESALRRLREQKLPLTPKMLAVLKSMCERYGVDY